MFYWIESFFYQALTLYFFFFKLTLVFLTILFRHGFYSVKKGYINENQVIVAYETYNNLDKLVNYKLPGVYIVQGLFLND